MRVLGHPSYEPALERVGRRFQKHALSFVHLRPVVFLCGGHDSPARATLARYVQKYHSDIFLFYADDVWDHIRDATDANALAMEAELAELADLIIVIVESPGTFAELGAFSMHDVLRKKLLPILDHRYKSEQSFVNTGPVHWVNQDSYFTPSIHTDLGAILTDGDTVVNQIARIPDRGPLPKGTPEDLSAQSKRLLFLLADLIAVAGPIPLPELSRLVLYVIGDKPKWTPRSLVGLLHALRLVNSIDVGSTKFYYRPLEGGELRAFQSARLFDLAEERAEFLATLEQIPAVRRILELMASDIVERGENAA